MNKKHATMVSWMLGMEEECGLSITLQYVKMVAKLSQTKPIPFKDEIIGNN
jgi:hypothetical protein